jgi:hypothetical protein
VISRFITGKFGLAAAIASVEVITKIILYYLHERAWAIIPWGKMTLVAHRQFGLRDLEAGRSQCPQGAPALPDCGEALTLARANLTRV